MANFTTKQASACIFATCESLKTNGIHTCWCIGMTDENGNYYEWIDKTLPGDATESQIKAASKNTLLTMEFKSTPTTESSTPILNIIGQNID